MWHCYIIDQGTYDGPPEPRHIRFSFEREPPSRYIEQAAVVYGPHGGLLKNRYGSLQQNSVELSRDLGTIINVDPDHMPNTRSGEEVRFFNAPLEAATRRIFGHSRKGLGMTQLRQAWSA